MFLFGIAEWLFMWFFHLLNTFQQPQKNGVEKRTLPPTQGGYLGSDGSSRPTRPFLVGEEPSGIHPLCSLFYEIQKESEMVPFGTEWVMGREPCSPSLHKL